MALSLGWIHGLISQSVRMPEWNSVVVGSNPTQANFLKLLVNPSVSGEYDMHMCMCIYIYKRYLTVNRVVM